MTIISRRNLLVASGAAAASPLLNFNTSAQSNKINQTMFDLDNPRDNLEALVKIFGDQNGGGVWFGNQGQVYALRDGEMPIPIFATEGVRYVKLTKNDTGYTFGVRDWGFYKDLQTGKVMDFFDNPFTGEQNQTNHILTGFMSWQMDEYGQHVPNYDGEIWLADKPLKLPWNFDGENVSVSLEILMKYPNGSAGGEWLNLMTNVSELNDPSITSTATRLQWTGHSDWVRWMNMGEVKGRTLWNSTGHKRTKVNDLRPYLIELAEKYFPGSLADPEGYEKTSYTVSPPEVILKKPE